MTTHGNLINGLISAGKGPWNCFKMKQPIFVDFDTKMTKQILIDIIDRLNQIGFKVVCCVSDCGGGNVGLLKELEVNHENPIFYTPNGQSVACVPDAPHLLKLIRNWFLDTGFNLNGNEINKKPIETLMSKITTEVNVCHKLTPMHLTCEGSLVKDHWLLSFYPIILLQLLLVISSSKIPN